MKRTLVFTMRAETQRGGCHFVQPQMNACIRQLKFFIILHLSGTAESDGSPGLEVTKNFSEKTRVQAGTLQIMRTDCL